MEMDERGRPPPILMINTDITTNQREANHMSAEKYQLLPASPPEQFEALKADKINVVEQNGVLPRSYAIKAGNTTNDTV